MSTRDNSYFEYLQSLNVEEFRSRVEAFWEHPPNTDRLVMDAFMHVVAVDNRFVYPARPLMYGARQVMWRARWLAPDDTQVPLREMNTQSDLWEAPAAKVKRGRLNDVGEPVLYVSIGDPAVAMVEARIKEGERFALIRYETSRPVTLCSVADPAIPPELLDELLPIHNDVMGFHRSVFTREFDGVGELSYVLSNRLVKDYYDLPGEVIDGWAFPSIARRQGKNAAFRPDKARETLVVTGVVYCEAADSALLGPRVLGRHFTTGQPEDDGNFVWWPMGSELQRSSFREFRC